MYTPFALKRIIFNKTTKLCMDILVTDVTVTNGPNTRHPKDLIL